MIKVILMWLCFIPIPFINGTLRETWYKKKVNELWANIIGVKFLSLSFLIYTYLFFAKNLNSLSFGQMTKFGFIWLIMTVVFEFGIGLVTGKDFKYMLADYNIFKGRLWPVFLVVVLFSLPIVSAVIKILN
jgi:hypothetical protein